MDDPWEPPDELSEAEGALDLEEPPGLEPDGFSPVTLEVELPPGGAPGLGEPSGFEEPLELEPAHLTEPFEAEPPADLPVPQASYELPGLTPREKRPRAVLFGLGDADYAVEAGQVMEIEVLGDVVELPNVPEWLLGVTQLRGEIVSVVDLRTLAGQPSSAVHGGETRVLVVRAPSGDVVTAFAVDRVAGIRELGPVSPPDRTPPVPESLAAFSSEARRVDGRDVRLADLGGLLASPRLRNLE